MQFSPLLHNIYHLCDCSFLTPFLFHRRCFTFMNTFGFLFCATYRIFHGYNIRFHKLCRDLYNSFVICFIYYDFIKINISIDLKVVNFEQHWRVVDNLTNGWKNITSFTINLYLYLMYCSFTRYFILYNKASLNSF